MADLCMPVHLGWAFVFICVSMGLSLISGCEFVCWCPVCGCVYKQLFVPGYVINVCACVSERCFVSLSSMYVCGVCLTSG